MSPAIITLTTDFGLRDSYVAEMKGVILGIARDVHIVDITHDVSAHDIVEGALTLEAAAPHFPPGTIHVAVIDPGVGTARRGLAIAWREWVFIGPDNGVFTPFLREDSHVVQLTAPEFRRPTVSATFHGRDVFAPAAAHLALGVDAGRLGEPVRDPVRLSWPSATNLGDRVEGTVVLVDRFGNLVTSVDAETVADLGPDSVVHVAGRTLPVVRTYGDLPAGGLGGLIGSRGRLEIAAREERAAALLGAGRGTLVLLSPSRSASPRSPTSRRRSTSRRSPTSRNP